MNPTAVEAPGSNITTRLVTSKAWSIYPSGTVNFSRCRRKDDLSVYLLLISCRFTVSLSSLCSCGLKSCRLSLAMFLPQARSASRYAALQMSAWPYTHELSPVTALWFAPLTDSSTWISTDRSGNEGAASIDTRVLWTVVSWSLFLIRLRMLFHRVTGLTALQASNCLGLRSEPPMEKHSQNLTSFWLYQWMICFPSLYAPAR